MSKAAVALWDFVPDDDSTISLKAGDKLKIADDSNPEWTLIDNLRTGENGFVPSNYIGPDTSSIADIVDDSRFVEDFSHAKGKEEGEAHDDDDEEG